MSVHLLCTPHSSGTHLASKAGKHDSLLGQAAKEYVQELFSEARSFFLRLRRKYMDIYIYDVQIYIYVYILFRNYVGLIVPFSLLNQPEAGVDGPSATWMASATPSSVLGPTTTSAAALATGFPSPMAMPRPTWAAVKELQSIIPL